MVNKEDKQQAKKSELTFEEVFKLAESIPDLEYNEENTCSRFGVVYGGCQSWIEGRELMEVSGFKEDFSLSAKYQADYSKDPWKYSSNHYHLILKYRAKVFFDESYYVNSPESKKISGLISKVKEEKRIVAESNKSNERRAELERKIHKEEMVRVKKLLNKLTLGEK